MGGAIGFGIAYFGPQLLALISSSLPALGTAGVTSALAVAGGGSVTLSTFAVQLAVGTIGIGVFLFSLGADRFKPKNTGSNTSQNEFIDHLQNKYSFSDKVRRRLHDRITKRGYSNKKVEEILRKMLGLD